MSCCQSKSILLTAIISAAATLGAVSMFGGSDQNDEGDDASAMQLRRLDVPVKQTHNGNQATNQNQNQDQAGGDGHDERPQQQSPLDVGGFPDLVGALKNTEGCLGVETAKTSSGKNVIFAWFEDKKAVARWYYSDVHLGVMDTFFGDDDPGKPLEGIPDDIGPVMAIASITFSDKQHFAATNLPISQIAVELYAPVKGGLFLGDTFAPKGLKVKGMTDYTPASAQESGDSD